MKRFLVWVENVRERFQSLGFRSRLLFLFPATVFLLIKLGFFIFLTLMPIFDELKYLDEFKQTQSLIHFDILVLLTLFCLVVFCSVLLIGTRKGRMIAVKRVNRRPIVVFFVTTLISFIIYLTIPTFIAKLFIDFRTCDFGSLHESMRCFLPNIHYINPAFFTSVSLGVYFSHELTWDDQSRWWFAPFAFIPVWIFNFFPLLWISFFSWWMPSKYWSIWRLPAAFVSCFLMVLYFPITQPIRGTMPEYHSQYFQKLYVMGDGAYDAYLFPGKDEVLITNSTVLARYKKNENGSYFCSEMLPLFFRWNEASYDFDQGKGYIHDMDTSFLSIVDIENLTVLDRIEIPPESFPVKGDYLHQAIDVKNRRLVVSDYFGTIYSLNIDTLQLDKTASILGIGRISQIMADPSTGLLYVLFTNVLKVLDINSLQVTATVCFKDRAAGIYTNNALDKLYISFPKLMKVKVFDKAALKELKVFDAPAGVRNILANLEQNLLFEASVSGIVEMRALDTGKLLKRRRIVIWAHWLEIIPRYKQLLITGGDTDGAIWNYDADDELPKFDEKIFNAFELKLRSVMKIFNKNFYKQPFACPEDNPLVHNP